MGKRMDSGIIRNDSMFYFRSVTMFRGRSKIQRLFVVPVRP
jgi:hypothetical protein